ncbi:CPP1-like family protein [Chroococcidiopsis sp. FACHB-1243]|uniref:CPP1-like family protein n=1 Tax=Chroococcidiopsis sp. [FACHB-1243] TaxID=2692781 RepID=UPI00177BAF52|nr:CPP1-like family protein [Chroococcidiopsis sp. [FACHB-1243]]MBD2308008.1 CPP1-like family protein [Chroococcidiopsis sp. [FACHB-1243]]
MIEQSPYDKLGLSEDATFDEIQEARTRLVQQCSNDQQLLETVEAAYDAILMERLRLRQEGKIKVPEGIRFAETSIQSPPKEVSSPAPQAPAWLQGIQDKPSLTEILMPGVLYLGLSCIGVFYSAVGTQILQFLLIVGVCSSLYFLYRKEQKFGRAVLLTATGLIVGLIGGGLIGSLLQTQIASIVTVEQFSTALTFVLLWVISSFLR